MGRENPNEFWIRITTINLANTGHKGLGCLVKRRICLRKKKNVNTENID